MGYYVRAFCASDAVPTVNAVLDDLRGQGLQVTAEGVDTAQLDSPEWTEFELSYKPGNLPIPVECNRNSGEDSLASEEVSEFLEELEELDDSPSKARVTEHLKSTRFIITCQLLSDVADGGYETNSAFLDYFVRNCGGMVYADLEGFYDGEEMLLPMR